MAEHFKINCTDVLGLACKGEAILEINKRMLKTKTVRKSVWANYVKKVYKNWDCLELVADLFFFFFVCKKLQLAYILTVGRKIRIIIIFFRPYDVP